MKDISTLASPVPCYLSEKEIQSIAEKLAKIMKIKIGASLDNAVELLNGKIEYVPPVDMTNKLATITVKKSNDNTSPPEFTIRLSPLMSSWRKRFVIAHELGHLLLHSQYGRFDLEAAHDDLLDKNANLVESEANCFATALLVPRAELKSIKSKNLPTAELAAHFAVPLPVMENLLKA